LDSSTPPLQIRVDNRENLLDAVLNVDGHLEECWIVLRTNQQRVGHFTNLQNHPTFTRHQEMHHPTFAGVQFSKLHQAPTLAETAP